MALRMNPYIITNGNGMEAIEFYKEALGAQVLFVQKFEEMPGYDIPEAAKGRVSHALLKAGETELMISDTFPGSPYQIGNQVAVCIMTDDAAEARRIFDALQSGGRVDMPLQETFWSPAYGIVTDKFGVSFNISTEKAQG